MQTIFSTADVPQADAFEYWRHLTSMTVAKHDLEVGVADRATFHGELRAGRVCDLTIATWQRSQGRAHIGNDNDLLLALPASRSIVEFSNRRFQPYEINRANISLLDARMTSTISHLEPVESAVVRIPPDALERRLPVAEGGGAINRPIPLQNDADAGLLVSYVRQLAHTGPSKLSPTVIQLARQMILDLTATVFSRLTGQTARLGAANEMVMLRLRAAIEAQLTNPRAGTVTIATAADVSARHASRVLRQLDSSISDLLLERRLAKCAEALRDPRYRLRSIDDIAASYCLRKAFFVRVFTRRYGVSPQEYRAKR